MSPMKSPISTAICILSGTLVLMGSLIDVEVIDWLRDVLLNWAIILAGSAIIVGVIHLLRFHLVRIKSKAKGSFNSAVLVCSFLFSMVIVGYFGLSSDWALFIYNSILIPIETSLVAILAIFLLLALPKLLFHKMDFETIFFIAVVVLSLSGSVTFLKILMPGLFGETGFIGSIINLVSLSGIRGLLLGIALGATATGIRIILGSDRPYSD